MVVYESELPERKFSSQKYLEVPLVLNFTGLFTYFAIVKKNREIKDRE